MSLPPPDPRAEDPAADAALLQRAARGDRPAFEELYRRLAPSVMSFLHHLTGDRGLAEDATQETFVKAWRAASRFDPARGKVRTWLFQIAKNHAWNALPRWRRLRGAGESFGDDALGADPAAPAAPAAGAPEAHARREELAEALSRAIAGLSETLRAVFVLVRIEGHSYADVAAVLDVPVGTVKSRMAAAEAYLRERLKGVR